jgi:O-antigen/teichoic acid export membrane protein
VTTLDLLRQLLTVIAIAALVAVGAGLVHFLAISIPVGFAVAVATVLTMRRRGMVRPSLDRSEWVYLTREALPVAIASAIGSFFYRSAIIVMSLLATAEETGYFSASFRITEAIIMVPGLLVAAAFPIAARAAYDDHERLAHTLQGLFEMGVILGAWTALGVVLGAGPAIDLVGGSDFEPAKPVLRVQGSALVFSYLVAVWATGLWALREQRALAWANLIGVGTAVGLTAALIPLWGALGAAIAMTIAEGLLAAMYGFILMRHRAHLRPSLTVVPKAIAAAVVALALWFTPLPDLINVLLATFVFYGLLFALRGIPVDFMNALRDRRRRT